MFGALFLIILFFGLNQIIIGFYSKRHSFIDKKILNLLYFYHILFFAVYLWYAFNNPSDSTGYYRELTVYPGKWIELFGTDKMFVKFVAYPFYLVGFNYEIVMLTFAWFGYLGFLYAYLFIREKIPIKIKVFKSIDLLTLILFFPNMHFWTASLGKGSLIFLGLMMFTYAIAKPGARFILLIIGSVIIFYIRPHVFMFVSVGAVAGYMSGKEKIPLLQKFLLIVSLVGGLIIAQDQILNVVGLQGSENLVEDFQSFSEDRSEDLSRAGSGVDMSNYPLLFKLFTFWFRPLFIDAPNILGLIISVENLIYLLLFMKMVNKDFVKFILKSPSTVKMSFVIFFMTSFAMTFVMSNLGIIMRQKSMVMYFIFFVIYYYLAEKKYKKLQKYKLGTFKLKKKTSILKLTFFANENA